MAEITRGVGVSALWSDGVHAGGVSGMGRVSRVSIVVVEVGHVVC